MCQRGFAKMCTEYLLACWWCNRYCKNLFLDIFSHIFFGICNHETKCAPHQYNFIKWMPKSWANVYNLKYFAYFISMLNYSPMIRKYNYYLQIYVDWKKKKHIKYMFGYIFLNTIILANLIFAITRFFCTIRWYE